jgi:hypothetical protein
LVNELPRPTLTTLLGASLAALGLSYFTLTLIEQSTAYPLLEEAASLEAGGRYRSAPNANDIFDPQILTLSGLCAPRIEQALVTVRLAAIDAVINSDLVGRFDESLMLAEQELQRLLRCIPIDGNAWLGLAMVKTAREGPTQQALAALDASYENASAQRWVIRRRIPFVLRLVTAGIGNGLEIRVHRDIDLFLMDANSRDITDIYAATPQVGHTLLNGHLTRLPTQRYADAYRALANAGIDIRALPVPEKPAPRYPRPALDGPADKQL